MFQRLQVFKGEGGGDAIKIITESGNWKGEFFHVIAMNYLIAALMFLLQNEMKNGYVYIAHKK